MTDKLIVTTTCPDLDHARRIARALVEERLAACVQILPEIESIYRWQGTIQTATEVLLMIKTAEAKMAALTAAVERLHPYEVPEILALSIEHGLGSYLEWMDDELAPPEES